MARNRAPQERQQAQLQRKINRRASYDRILIVSEGSKTEPNYFHEIRIKHRLHTANLQVRPSELGTAPIQVVQYAHTLFERGDRHRSIQPRAFEHIYAVFDRDDHPSYVEALRLAESLDRSLKNDAKQLVRFRAIASVPSFELWLLLHFQDIQAPIHRDEVMRRLKQHLRGYEKGAPCTFAQTCEHLDIALARAGALAAKYSAEDAPQPYTAIHELVRLLTHLRT